MLRIARTKVKKPEPHLTQQTNDQTGPNAKSTAVSSAVTGKQTTQMGKMVVTIARPGLKQNREPAVIQKEARADACGTIQKNAAFVDYDN